ncbi:hypothetical protein HTZ77_17580 [Nonomuraea sp. SMC257]|uniref:Uncharacterized protein n=1 Tax=Nonomuraea montanisoli TaxID=2741721 RepID=A0A7Y6M307_9ACTN|nr:hypothetical protein [Nonomuraea montanisoli]NUW33228.1 hypothetical protein [Nonomuraea montanisoli]
MNKRLPLILTLLAAVLTGTFAGTLLTSSPQPSFWAKLRYGASMSDGQYLFDSVADIVPGASDSGAFKAAAALVQGTVVDIEPGIAYASDDGDSGAPVVPYDSQDAAMRYAGLVVRVDKVLAGRLGQGYTDGKIRIRVEQPATTTLAELKESIGTAGTGLMFVHNLAERQQLLGRPVTDPAQLTYARTVYTPIGEGLFVEESAGGPVVAPLMDARRAAQLLGYTYLSEDSEAEPSPTPTCDDLDPCFTPTSKPSATATSVPAGGTEPASTTPPSLTALRSTLLAAACAEGTSADSTSC